MNYLRNAFLVIFAITTLVLAGLVVYTKRGIIDPLLAQGYALNDYSQQLSQHLTDMKLQLQKVDDANASLNQQNATLSKDIQSTFSTLDQYQNQISDALKWFQNNATTAGKPTFTKLNQSITVNCVQVQGNDCAIKLECLTYQNQQAGFIYKTDQANLNRTDQLQDIAAFLQRKAGDCEDFSLLFNAELNNAENYCRQHKATNISYEALQKHPGTDTPVTFAGDVVSPNTQSVAMDTAIGYHAVVCGTLPGDLVDAKAKATNLVGHCLMGFSSTPLTNSANIVTFLQHSYLMEPQTGEDKGKLSDLSSIQIPDSALPDHKALIYMVIGTKDLFMFDNFYSQYRWFGYQDFLDKITGLETKLKATK